MGGRIFTRVRYVCMYVHCKNTFVIVTQFATGTKCYLDKMFVNFLQLLL